MTMVGSSLDVLPSNRARWIKGWLAAVMLAGVLFGCAGRPVSPLPETVSGPPLASDRGHRIAGVPFVPGDPGACGPAALSSVLAYWGDPVAVAEIARALAVPSLSGVLPLDLARFANHRLPTSPPRPGVVLEATTAVGSLVWLRDQLRLDYPVVAFLDLGFGPWRRGHFVVVVGYRDAADAARAPAREGEMLLYSGRDPNATMSYARFARAWERAGWWALVVAPADASGGASRQESLGGDMMELGA